MKVKIVQGVKHRGEAFGGVIESSEGITCLQEEEYNRFLNLTNSSEEVDTDEFLQELLDAKIVEPFDQL